MARNEVRCRELNERLQTNASSTFTEYVCECARDRCGGTVSLLVDEYEAVRNVGTRFIIARGHAVPDLERIVLDDVRYQVVEKLGHAAEVAENLDPRGPRRSS